MALRALSGLPTTAAIPHILSQFSSDPQKKVSKQKVEIEHKSSFMLAEKLAVE
jgi:HEAT repeat protein